jgi:hypothetical protein
VHVQGQSDNYLHGYPVNALTTALNWQPAYRMHKAGIHTRVNKAAAAPLPYGQTRLIPGLKNDWRCPVPGLGGS